jgi:hypothetical protein
MRKGLQYFIVALVKFFEKKNVLKCHHVCYAV